MTEINDKRGKDTPEQEQKTSAPAEPKIIDTVTVIELQMRKFDNGQEDLGIICHERLMNKHKNYLIKLLTKSINMVLDAKPQGSWIEKVNMKNRNKFRQFIRGFKK